MPFLVKGIKPKKLSIDAVRLELLNELRAEGRDSVKELEKTVRYWTKDKPKFETIIGLTGRDASVFVGPTGNTKGAQKWQWLDEGTRAHVILPRRARMLRFTVGGYSGSHPNSLDVRPAVSGTEVVFAKRVHHPGIAARNWSYLIQRRRKQKFIKRMLAAVKRGMEKAQR